MYYNVFYGIHVANIKFALIFLKLFFFFWHGPFLMSLLQYCFCFMVWFFGKSGIWDLNSPARDWTYTLYIGKQSLNHWTTREVPILIFLSDLCEKKNKRNLSLLEMDANYWFRLWSCPAILFDVIHETLAPWWQQSVYDLLQVPSLKDLRHHTITADCWPETFPFPIAGL